MKYSDNEALSLMTKAAQGAGYPAGVAVDLANAGLWLLRRGYDGVTSLVAALTAPPQPAMPISDGVWAEARAATAGLAALDLLLAGEAEDVRLERLDQPKLLIGLAGHLLQGTGFEIEANGARVVALGVNGTVPDEGTDVTLVLNKSDAPFAPQNAAEDVPPVSWAKARALARKTYVPTTPSSRANAGSAASDND